MSLKHITYGSNTSYPVAILIKSYLVDSAPKEIRKHYTDPLVALGIPIEDIIVIGLPYTDFKKATAKTLNTTIPDLQKYMDTVGVQQVLVADTPYLKRMAKRNNLTNLAGVLLPNVNGSQRLFKARQYTTYRFNDKAAERVAMGMQALADSYHGVYRDKDIIKEESYPSTYEGIKDKLDFLMSKPVLAVDIEGFGLRLDNCGIATIAFCWEEGKGTAFAVDYLEDHKIGKPNYPIRDLLLEFFTNYKGLTLYHGISFDVKQLVANLFMKNDLLDYPSMVTGMELMTQNAHCTKDISYLATNSAAGNILGLKHLTLEYTGEYALEVKDITLHTVQAILKYNLIDVLATFWLYYKMYPVMQARNQEELYLTRYQRNQRTLTTLELTGMPLDMDEVIRLRRKLDQSEIDLLASMRATEAVREFEDYKAMIAHCKYQNSVKGKGRTFTDYCEWKADELVFKPTSDAALVWILHEYYELPVIDKTMGTRQPSVADDTLKKHIAWIDAGNGNKDAKSFLEAVREYLKIVKINGTFVKAFITKSILKKDGVYYLHGSINQGGTLSGRLSSSDPNLTNLPSGGYWGKAIKRCFKPPPGKVMLASDYNALESRIAAMLTDDPNMVKVFMEGLDAHSANTYAYAEGTEPWYNQILDPNDPNQINKIKVLADADRSASKPTTFALQYLGDYRTLMNNQGFSEEKSKRLVLAFHNLYTTYFDYLEGVADFAQEQGYVNVAYGLRVDTPALGSSLHNTGVTPQAVAAEKRSICNAASQSYGQMNTFAADDFMRRVWTSKWRNSIHLQGLIHDAIYLFVPMDLEAIEFVNHNLIECMVSQMEVNISGSDVILEAELDIHYPTWKESFTLPNHADQLTISHHIHNFLEQSNES